MATAGVVEPDAVLEDGCLGLVPSSPFLPADQLCLQRFEERLDRRIVITIAFATHRPNELVFLELPLVITEFHGPLFL
jgi:hypothetical protein